MRQPQEMVKHIFKQFVDTSRRIASVCLTILWGWRLKGLKSAEKPV